MLVESLNYTLIIRKLKMGTVKNCANSGLYYANSCLINEILFLDQILIGLKKQKGTVMNFVNLRLVVNYYVNYWAHCYI